MVMVTRYRNSYRFCPAVVLVGSELQIEERVEILLAIWKSIHQYGHRQERITETWKICDVRFLVLDRNTDLVFHDS